LNSGTFHTFHRLIPGPEDVLRPAKADLN